LISALDGSEWSASSLESFIPEDITPNIGYLGWVDHRTGLDAVENKISTLQTKQPSCLPNSLLLYLSPQVVITLCKEKYILQM
jgi:hypothetical protein